MTALLADRLPLNERELGNLLVSDGLTLAPPPLHDLERFFRAWGRRVPFRIVRCGGMQIAVAPERHREAAAVGAAAIRMVQHWGLVGIDEVAARAETQTSKVISTETARRVVRALPRTCWLDGSDRRWFSLLGARSGALTAIGKVFAVADEVPLGELRAALVKALPAIAEVPVEAFARYVVEVARCTVAGDRARLARPAAVLTRPETTLLELLRAAGGSLDLATLRRRADAASLPDTTLGRLLRLSPLVLPIGRNCVRIVGGAVPSLVS
jgi:hypothetical protein